MFLKRAVLSALPIVFGCYLNQPITLLYPHLATPGAILIAATAVMPATTTVESTALVNDEKSIKVPLNLC